MTRRGTAIGLAAALLASTALSCRSSQPDSVGVVRDARSAALLLFRAGREGTPPEQLGSLVEGELAGARRAALARLLEEIASTTSVRVLEEAAVSDRTALDLEATLRGGGTARYQVQVRAGAGTFRIVSVVGPGASWPQSAASGGDGLSTSAPPARMP